jgi:hypothetical protein
MLPFHVLLLGQPPSPGPKELSPQPDERAKELLLDALIRESYRDNNALEEPMTILEVFNSV